MVSRASHKKTHVAGILSCGLALLSCIWLADCTLDSLTDGPHPPTDAKLDRNFRFHEAEFSDLIALFQADSRVISISAEYISVDDGRMFKRSDLRHGFSSERWKQYDRLFDALELKDGLSKPIGGDVTYLTSYSWGLPTSSVTKGYAYAGHDLFPLLESLDTIKDLQGKKVAYKKLKGHWYLYLYGD